MSRFAIFLLVVACVAQVSYAGCGCSCIEKYMNIDLSSFARPAAVAAVPFVGAGTVPVGLAAGGLATAGINQPAIGLARTTGCGSIAVL